LFAFGQSWERSKLSLQIRGCGRIQLWDGTSLKLASLDKFGIAGVIDDEILCRM
jgi:hypothetical protein